MELLQNIDENEAINGEEEYEWENRRRWIEDQMTLLARHLKESNVNAENTNVVVELNEKELTKEKSKENMDFVEEILPKKLDLPKPAPVPSTKSEPKESGTIKFSETIQSDHDSLTNDLISTVRLIKRNNLALRQIVQDDDKALDETALLLADNSGKMGREGGNLKKYSRSAWSTTWKLLGLMLVVMVTFLFMYLFIKVTRK